MDDQPYFVQFPHPGREHAPRTHDMGWNRSVHHARKFMKVTGTYLDDAVERSGPVTIWGEWEPPSTVTHRFARSAPGMPRVLHEPHLNHPSDGGWRQNTDPFVFGPRMIYSNCRQLRNRKLRSMASGSVVLFGSRVAGEFVLDTLLVVHDSQRLEMANPTNEGWSAAEWNCVVEPLSLDPDLASCAFRCYEGTNYGASGGSLFSFVPCLPWSADGAPFRRPIIRLNSRWLTPGLAQAAKATPATEAELQSLWWEVREQVEAQDLCLGVHLQIPAS